MTFQVKQKFVVSDKHIKYEILKEGQHKYNAIMYEDQTWPIAYDVDFDNDIVANKVIVMTNGYVSINRKYLHRHIYLKNKSYEDQSSKDKKSIDHINNFKLDNRLANLRLATQSEQNSNRLQRSDKLLPCDELINIGVEQLPKHVRWDKTAL